MVDLDTEQQNQIRLALGLKPLPGASGGSSGPQFKDHSSSDESEEEASTLATREAAAYDNWKTVQDDADAKKRRAAKSEAIKKARDSVQKQAKLDGKGLGDQEGTGDQDTRAWLQGTKKRQKKLEKERARKLEAELVERERIAAVEYGAKDLAGVKVGHEIGDFDDGEGEQILTLKDTTIDENEEEGDELENAELKEREKLNNRLDLKKKKPVYDPHAADEDGERKVLAHYDEEIEGKKRKQFVFDGQGTTAEERDAKRQEMGQKLKAQPLTFDFAKIMPESDYVQASEIKVKKPKKSKKKATRQKAVDEDDIFPTQTNGDDSHPNAMEVDGQDSKPKKSEEADKSFIDDEDLQASLAVQRRAAFKKRKRQRPEDIAREINEDASATPGDMDIDGDESGRDEPGLVIDETSEFVANLQNPLDTDEPRPKRAHRADDTTNTAAPASDSGSDSDTDMNQAPTISDPDNLLAQIKPEEDPTASLLTTTGLREEATLDTGLGATFSLLKERGLVKTSESGDLNALHRDRQRFLAEKQTREAAADLRARLQRERDRTSGKLERMSAREREDHARWENKQRDTVESRVMADVFNREYKPDVQLRYVDEHGRNMGAKEAFKHLSHQFHGKGSGKLKTEKHLKKIGEEKKREAMSALDAGEVAGRGMGGAAVGTGRRKGTAGVRLG